MNKGVKLKKKIYDHRLRDFVRLTGDVKYAESIGVPRSTARSWLTAPVQEVVSDELFDLSDLEVRARIVKLERQVKILTAVMGLFIMLIRLLDCRIDFQRFPKGKDKDRLLRAVERTRKVLSLRTALKIIDMSATRYYSWIRSKQTGCDLDDLRSCPKSNPRQLLPEEIQNMQDMVTSQEYRHVPTCVLAVLAQRLKKVFATPATWYRYIRERNWRRPRNRIHPAKPTLGLRTNKPNATWHVDTTVIRLLDGTKAYLQAIIDNYSRRILAWRLDNKLDPTATAGLLVRAFESAREAKDRTAQKLMVDGGVENFNAAVEKLVNEGLLRLILAQTDISYSNSLIEAFWRILKHHWLYLNQLDSIGKLRNLVEFYIDQYNRHLPHSAFRGQTPDEMYFCTGSTVPEELAAARRKAMNSRLESNRKMTCGTCEAMPDLEFVTTG